MALINIKIEGIPYQVEEGLTVLEAARRCGFEIPSLCAFNHGECSQASCRVCLVQVNTSRSLVASCVYPVSDGLEISISSPVAIEARRTSVELLLSNHAQNCQACDKNGKCELLYVAQQVGPREGKYKGSHTKVTFDHIGPSLVRDTSKCILCGRCIARCSNAHGMGILGFENRGFNTIVGPAENRTFADSPCIMCGQCTSVCATGALMEKLEILSVDKAIEDGKYVVCQTAPAVRAALGEEFGYQVGTAVTGKMVAALRRLGFKKVFDTNFGADLTIMEEANELIERISSGGKLPMITSCSPGWINYAEYFYSDLLPHVSSCKSPHQMQGAIIKHYYAKKVGIKPEDVVVVSVMPCTAKKFEKEREQLVTDGIKDVDIVITTRELAKMIRRCGINFHKLPDEEFDMDIIGGVMEAALRTACYRLTGKEAPGITFESVRGVEGLKESQIQIGDQTVYVAVASGMKNAKILLDEIREGRSKYTFIEIMGCPGGCINGGGQPIVRECFLPQESHDIGDTYIAKRAVALYTEDERKFPRQSHNNQQIQMLYRDFLGCAGSEIAHKLLHTSFKARVPFN